MKRALLVAIVVSGCGYPNTDITSTNTERVGNYEVVNARSGESLAADVCVDEPGNVDAIAVRVMHQLANHGYRTITLNMYGHAGPIARVEQKNGQILRSELNPTTTAVPPACSSMGPG